MFIMFIHLYALWYEYSWRVSVLLQFCEAFRRFSPFNGHLTAPVLRVSVFVISYDHLVGLALRQDQCPWGLTFVFLYYYSLLNSRSIDSISIRMAASPYLIHFGIIVIMKIVIFMIVLIFMPDFLFTVYYEIYLFHSKFLYIHKVLPSWLHL